MKVMRSRGFGLLVGAAVVLLAAVNYYLSSTQDFVNGSSVQTQAQRQLSVAVRAVDQKMKARIASVKRTGKVTDAMRLVAAARVRRAQDGVAKSRPFSDELQGMIKGLTKRLKGTGLEAELPMLKVPEKVNNVAILLITSNRGLCGSYNSQVIKQLARRVKSLNEQGITPRIVIVGRKGNTAMRGARMAGAVFNYTGNYFPMPDTISAKSADEISLEIRDLFLSGEVDKVEVHYAKFVNLLTRIPSIRSLLPLSPTGIESSEDETFRLTTEDGKMKVVKEKAPAAKAKDIESDVIFDQPPEVILNSMLPLYLNSQILSILYDAQASELSARMTAMKAATDNAADVVAKLTTIYNKKRQMSITQELCEVTAGALALEDTDKDGMGRDLSALEKESDVTDEFLKELTEGGIPDRPVEPFTAWDGNAPDFMETIEYARQKSIQEDAELVKLGIL